MKQKLCPKCRNTLEHDMSVQSIVLSNAAGHYTCRKCGYNGMFFLEKK